MSDLTSIYFTKNIRIQKEHSRSSQILNYLSSRLDDFVSSTKTRPQGNFKSNSNHKLQIFVPEESEDQLYKIGVSFVSYYRFFTACIQ